MKNKLASAAIVLLALSPIPGRAQPAELMGRPPSLRRTASCEEGPRPPLKRLKKRPGKNKMAYLGMDIASESKKQGQGERS